MLKGVAHAGRDDFPEDRYAAIVALSQLSDRLASVESKKAFNIAAETASILLRVPRVAIFAKDGKEGLELEGLYGEPISDEAISAARNVVNEAFDLSSPLLITNTAAASSQPAKSLANSGIASLICVPMRIGKQTVGAILCMSDIVRSFSPQDIELLHVIASHAALAVLRAKTSENYESAQTSEDLLALADRKIRELSLLNQISEAINSTLDLDALLDIALEECLAAVDADGGSLMLINEETGRLEIVASRGLPQQLAQSTSQEIGKSIAGWVAEHGESVLVTDARKDQRFVMPFYRDAITSSASVPLKSKNGPIGVLNVNTTRAERIFDERDLQFLQTIANQMATAIENARLYGRVQRRTQQLSGLLRISRTVTSTLSLDECLKLLSDEMCKLLEFDVCVIFLVDDVTNRLRYGIGRGLKTRDKFAYYDLGNALALRVLKTGRRIHLQNINSSRLIATEVSRAESLTSAIGLPLKSNDRIVAVATLFARDKGDLPQNKRALLNSLSEIAGVAIHNAHVYQQKYRIARLVQKKLIPTTALPHIPTLEIGHKFFSVREVGGDYYDFIALDDQRLAVVVADVSGSDVEAAEHTAMGKYVLRAYARELVRPCEVLSKTNNLICEMTGDETFISAFYAVVDVQSEVISYANAGCEPAVLYSASDGTIWNLHARGILLGVTPDCSYEEQSVPFRGGDVLVAFTDGVTEASINRNWFGMDSAKRVVAENAHLDAQSIADKMFEALMDFTGGKVSDDVAVIVVKRVTE